VSTSKLLGGEILPRKNNSLKEIETLEGWSIHEARGERSPNSAYRCENLGDSSMCKKGGPRIQVGEKRR